MKATVGKIAVLTAAALLLQACGPAKGSGGAVAQLSPAQTCLQTLDPAQGIDVCRQAMTDNPNDPALRRRMALLRLKSGAWPAARQAYQIVLSADPNDAEAQFGLGLTLQAIGEANANDDKKQAAARDPSVIDKFRKYGFSEPELMMFDTAPVVFGGQSPEADKAMEPKQPLAQGLTVNVRCLVGLDSKLHDCVAITPLTPAQAAYGEAAKTILMATKVHPARDKGAPIADAPIVLTYVFWPRS